MKRYLLKEMGEWGGGENKFLYDLHVVLHVRREVRGLEIPSFYSKNGFYVEETPPVSVFSLPEKPNRLKRYLRSSLNSFQVPSK